MPIFAPTDIVQNVMKRKVTVSIITGSIAAAGIIYMIRYFKKKSIQSIQLDFTEYALGGN